VTALSRAQPHMSCVAELVRSVGRSQGNLWRQATYSLAAATGGRTIIMEPSGSNVSRVGCLRKRAAW